MQFLSQQGEDIYILLHFINKKNPNGVFVELGACDGLVYSNTYFFERYLNFKGILIEPNKDLFKKLEENKKTHRSQSICIQKAINTEKDDVLFLSSTTLDNKPCGGIKKHMSDDHISMWFSKDTETYTVETATLSSIFLKNNITYIDFFSLDVEGGELEVLQTIDFTKVEIYVICIELTNKNGEHEQKCRQLLLQKGFTFKQRMSINEFWVNDQYSRTNEVYNPNISIPFNGIENNSKRSSTMGTHPFTELSQLDTINKLCKNT